MAHIKIKLVGCDRYGFKGQGYERGKVYVMPEAKAKILLAKEDEYGRPYFAVYTKPEGKTREQRIAEAAAAAAAEAARQEVEAELVDMTGESHDAGAYVEPVTGDPDVAEVDTDDDPSLDEPDAANPEEVPAEDADRSDGSEVKV